MASADMNDVIALLHGRASIVADVVAAPTEVREALRQRCLSISERDIDDAVLNYALGNEFDAVRREVAERILAIVAPESPPRF